ncbi:uncharacterized protein EV154DRAFT_482707 [Mucor mucedo]|uniref:uncharacterized protein n=1 Tax=Mucor mucedo TaxID=29922 RepID=UPI0022206B75|nr:uncharacterized protein EV154DRAFT_482707 [Mucor mucedo]KAI7889845.1 hypothetical protein EV154DRAFT_482707 [Mucor mucedo]
MPPNNSQFLSKYAVSSSSNNKQINIDDCFDDLENTINKLDAVSIRKDHTQTKPKQSFAYTNPTSECIPQERLEGPDMSRNLSQFLYPKPSITTHIRPDMQAPNLDRHVSQILGPQASSVADSTYGGYNTQPVRPPASVNNSTFGYKTQSSNLGREVSQPVRPPASVNNSTFGYKTQSSNLSGQVSQIVRPQTSVANSTYHGHKMQNPYRPQRMDSVILGKQGFNAGKPPVSGFAPLAADSNVPVAPEVASDVPVAPEVASNVPADPTKKYKVITVKKFYHGRPLLRKD